MVVLITCNDVNSFMGHEIRFSPSWLQHRSMWPREWDQLNQVVNDLLYSLIDRMNEFE